MDLEYIQEVRRGGYDYYEVIVREKSIRRLFNIKKWKLSEVQRWRDCKIKSYRPPKIQNDWKA